MCGWLSEKDPPVVILPLLAAPFERERLVARGRRKTLVFGGEVLTGFGCLNANTPDTELAKSLTNRLIRRLRQGNNTLSGILTTA